MKNWTEKHLKIKYAYKILQTQKFKKTCQKLHFDRPMIVHCDACGKTAGAIFAVSGIGNL